MKSVSLSGSRRANVGKKDAAAARNSGKVPCVIYGGKEQVPFTVDEIALKKIVWSPDAFEVALDIDGSKYRSIIQEIQFHPVTDRVNHVDFLLLDDNKKVKFQIPVKLTGAAEGVKKGGRLVQNFRRLTVSALPKHLPDKIEIDISPLEIGQGIRVRELNVEGITFLDNAASYVVSVQTTRNVAEETPADAAKGAAPAAAPAADAKAPAKK